MTVQILDSWGVEQPQFGDCGGIYERWTDGRGFEGHPPAVNASRPPGQWQTFDVIFRAPRFDASGKKVENARFVKVVHNGQVIHREVEVTGPTRAATYESDEKPAGPLMLQGDHGPVAYRNLRLRPVQQWSNLGRASYVTACQRATWQCSEASRHPGFGLDSGRGKLEKSHSQIVPIKRIFFRQLRSDFRELLCF